MDKTCNRVKKKGGGVCLYIVYNVRNDLTNFNNLDYTESLFIEIDNTGSQNVIIGIVYRQPDQNIKDFISIH